MPNCLAFPSRPCANHPAPRIRSSSPNGILCRSFRAPGCCRRPIRSARARPGLSWLSRTPSITRPQRFRQRRFAGGAGSFFGLITAFAAGSAPAGDLQLARLAGSAREVADCAAAWQAPRLPIFLEGAAASRERLRRALETRPAVLHFATHVVQSTVNSGAEARSGLIVLSLNQAGQHEVLSPVEVATWNLHGAVVSLSGCSSGSAEALPATGLVGLTRACLAAGARAVVASRWPTPDDTGALFLAFYRYLHDSPEAGPAVALQRAQIDMLRSGTWRLHPVYWAAYFVTGNQP